jgi:hypothetical protein
MKKPILFGLWVFILSFFLTVRPAHSQELSEQIITDLITIGITGAATLTGNIPLALASGVLSKYISTYGVQGAKALVTKIKGETPEDLGQINIYFIYLIHVKRNLYQAMINIRSNVKGEQSLETIAREIDELEKTLSGKCPEGVCQVTGIDESLVNFEFLNIALDAKQSFDIFQYLSQQEVKTTYQYLMLLYMDLILVEQKLLEAQYNVLANQVATLLENFEENVFISNDEKEYAFQLAINMVLKWQKHRDERRIILLTALRKPLQDMQEENRSLEDSINGYRGRNGDLRKILMGF